MTGPGLVFAAAGDELGRAIVEEGERGGAIPILLGPEDLAGLALYAASEQAAAEVRWAHRFMLMLRMALRERAEEIRLGEEA